MLNSANTALLSEERRREVVHVLNMAKGAASLFRRPMSLPSIFTKVAEVCRASQLMLDRSPLPRETLIEAPIHALTPKSNCNPSAPLPFAQTRSGRSGRRRRSTTRRTGWRACCTWTARTAWRPSTKTARRSTTLGGSSRRTCWHGPRSGGKSWCSDYRRVVFTDARCLSVLAHVQDVLGDSAGFRLHSTLSCISDADSACHCSAPRMKSSA